MTPAEQHAAVLAALDTLEAAAKSDADWHTPRPVDPTETNTRGLAPAQMFRDRGHRHPWSDNPAGFVAMLAGKRRTLERHAPAIVAYGSNVAPITRCEACAGLCHSRSGLACDDPIDGAWPCLEYRDAAAGLPDLPEGIGS